MLEALAQRHQDRTGKRLTASEIVAGALVISLPTLVRFFPHAAED